MKKLPIIGLIVGAIAMVFMRKKKDPEQPTEDSGSV
jgi:hypothetical protein